MILKIKKLDDDLPSLSFAKPGDAGADLRSTLDLTLKPGERATIPCGVAIGLPEGFCGFVIPRSGLASKYGITVVNAPGLIDSGYRGEICVVLLNTDKENEFKISKGDRIAQLAIVESPHIEFDEVSELDDTDRGNTGFGSSGVK